MFTMGDKSLTKENILKHVDSYQLFKTYCKNFKEIGEKFRSEFRKEKDPSCCISVWNGDLLYKDYGENSYRIFDFIARKFDLTYHEALQKVNNDFGLKLGYCVEIENSPVYTADSSVTDYKEHEKQGTTIEISPRKWTYYDKKYWSDYKIPLKLLEYHNIKSISHYRVTSKKKDKALYAVGPYQLAYSIDYYWNESIFRRKLYFPKSKTGRFVSNVDDTIVQGWTLLPRNGGEILFVTKSYKDILIFNLLGYWAIAPNNEGAFIPDSVMEKLKKRWNRIYVWFDNDEGGITGGNRFSERFNLPFTCNPKDEPKDPSDFVKRYSLKQFDKLVDQLLQKDYFNLSR